jgi:hypothetical protein
MPTLLLALALCGCQDILTREARYSGAMSPASACGSPGTATLMVAQGKASFAPNDGAVVLSGTVSDDGTLSAWLELEGADHKPYRLVVQGKVDRDHAEGVYATPRCRFALDLHRR